MARWQGWLAILDHPTGQGFLPANTTERQRTALRGLARALIYFSAPDAAGHRKDDGERFLARLRSISQVEGLTGESRLETVLQWVRDGHRVRIAPSHLVCSD